MMYIQFSYGQEERESVEYGPYTFVQMTYDYLRAGDDSFDLVIAFNRDGLWITADQQTWSDFNVYTK